MDESKIVLVIRSLFDERHDVIDIKLARVKDKIHQFIADETPAALAIEQAALERLPLVRG
ncbi:MAG: hypothetical protein ABJF01_19055 [bacterium]